MNNNFLLINNILVWLLMTVKTFNQFEFECPFDKRKVIGVNIEESGKNVRAINHKDVTYSIQRIQHFNFNAINISSSKPQQKRQNQQIENFALSNICNKTEHLYYRTYDGSCNNRLNPNNGMAYTRLLMANYADGIQEPIRSITGAPLPNARLLSLNIYGEETMPDDFRTLMLMQWGQIIAHDLSKFTTRGAPGDCCNQHKFHPLCDPIMLNPLDPMALALRKSCIHFARSRSNRNGEKITLTSSYLDLGFIYGDSIEQNRKVRLLKKGLLKTDSHRSFLPIIPNLRNECPKGSDHCFMMPDNRDQITPLVITLHILLVREHNRLAKILNELNSHYTDETLFQEARKINIAQYQKITYYDWLPLLLGQKYVESLSLIQHHHTLYTYSKDYKENINAAPYAECAAAAFRYGHHQIPGQFSLIFSDRHLNQTMRLSNYFNVPLSVRLLDEENNFDSLIRGLVTQLQKRSDDNIDKEIKHFFGRKLFNIFGVDLKAIDIQRGRDFGIRSYNDYREFCGLRRAFEWSDFSSEIPLTKIKLMRKMYASPHDVDLSVGGSLESHAPSAIFGPTFQCIIGRQFLKLRQSDRFFFEHFNIFSGFTVDQLNEIRKVSLGGLLCVNGDNITQMQKNVFIIQNKQNKLTNCKNFPQLNLKYWMEHQEL